MKQKPYNIHFVCRGNTYRSRLAAAYMASLLGEAYKVSSSGISSYNAKLKTSEKYTRAVAKAHKLTYQINTAKTQTTNELLKAADIIIFMKKDVYDDALKQFEFDERKAFAWDVYDISDDLRSRYNEAGQDVSLVLAIAEQTFPVIKNNCDTLYEYITAGSWTDVVDENNVLSGLRLPISWITDRGLWHRGIHVVVQTSDGKFVVGKRSKEMVFAPGMLEISLGGIIDSGEQPRRAAQRETHEEIGISLHEKSFRPLFVYKQSSYHPHYNKRSKVHIYVYAVTLPVHSTRLVPQAGEVAVLRLLTKRQIKHVLRAHRMENFGQLKWGYQLYNKAVAYSTLPL